MEIVISVKAERSTFGNPAAQNFTINSISTTRLVEKVCRKIGEQKQMDKAFI